MTIVVPWRSRLILAEVPDKASTCDPLSAFARYGGSALAMIGYDAIPVVSAETVPVAMADHFARFLSVVKWSESVVAISAAAAGEFRGFVSMLPAQGLVGPRVVEVALPADGVREVVVPVRERPLVVVVGSKEPRKNHVAVLFAAEVLWREGVDFEVLFIGTFGWDTRVFRRWLKRLQRAGRPVSAPARVGDSALWEAYAGARFTVFPSLHEGYGLPVAESLAYGTPVITTSYGSTAEIAAAGGCVLVDPRDDGQLVAAMRRLLSDDAEVERLRAEARGRPVWTWEQYAAQVWAVLGVSA
jgi:glycosyltransferase involved in cell wall biosynthesis